MIRLLTRAAMGLALAIGAGTAQAAIVNGSFLFSVMTGETNGAGFNAVAGAMPFTGSPASASFTYTGSLNFDLNQPQNSTNAGDLNSEFFATATNGGVGADYGITGYSGSGNFGDANANYVAGLAEETERLVSRSHEFNGESHVEPLRSALVGHCQRTIYAV
ncbi:MAG: hypothetical protein MUC42_07725 [Bryobacter sp.]|nr:hypothetical protein [Bryobacter sp.]